MGNRQRKPKTVVAWAFSRRFGSFAPFVSAHTGRNIARVARRTLMECGNTCGHVVRVEVPAPKELSK